MTYPHNSHGGIIRAQSESDLGGLVWLSESHGLRRNKRHLREPGAVLERVRGAHVRDGERDGTLSSAPASHSRNVEEPQEGRSVISARK